MSNWTDDRRLIYFICIFPVGIFTLLPFSSFAFDFTIIFALVWAVTFFLLMLASEKPISPGWLLSIGFSAIGLRLVIFGVALRKIVVQGPLFDGQIMRSIGEYFRAWNFETHIIFSTFLMFALFTIVCLISREISSIMLAFLDLAESSKQDEDCGCEKPETTGRESATNPYQISTFLARLSILEMRLVPAFLTVTIIAAVHFRDRLLPVSVEKSLQTSAVMILSLLICYVPLKLLSFAALREWMRAVTGKPVGQINLRLWIFENRYWLMATGLLVIGISFLPDFPRPFLVILAGVFFSAGFLSDVIETQHKTAKVEENLIANETVVGLVGHQVTLVLGREIWNEYYVLCEHELNSSLGHVRLKVIKESGIIFGEIMVEFSQRLRPDDAAVVLNGERVSKSRFRFEQSNSERSDDPGNNLDKERLTNRMTKSISDFVTTTLLHYIPSLSHDPAISHLVRNFQF